MRIVRFLFVCLGMLLLSCNNKEKPPTDSSTPAKPKSSAENPKALHKIIGTHAVGLCNMPLFIANELQLGKPFGVEISLKPVPDWSLHAAALKSGDVDISVTPFTNVLTAYANGAPIKIIAGSGMNGLFVLGQKGIKNWELLKGKKIGTFRADTLEVAAHDAFKVHGLAASDYQMIYFNGSTELMEAFAKGDLSAMTHVEPFVTKAIREYGAEVIGKGQEVWGGDHPDCVLVTTTKVLQQRPQDLKALIAAMLKAEAFIEGSYEKAVDLTQGKYYPISREELLVAGKAQPPGVDIRRWRNFILDRSRSLVEMGYISRPADEDLIDFSLLDEVIKEQPELWKSVKVRSE